MARGVVKRMRADGERGRHIYCPATGDISDSVNARDLDLKEPFAQVLSAMKPGCHYAAEDIAQFCEVKLDTLKRRLIYLARTDVLTLFAVGFKMFCALTSKGAAHPKFNGSGAKARPADIAMRIGGLRAAIMRTLLILKEARSVELTHHIEPGLFVGSKHTTGQVLQRLEVLGLVHAERKRKGDRACYCLTASGGRLASLLDRALPETTEAALRRYSASQCSPRRLAERTDANAFPHRVGPVNCEPELSENLRN